MSCKPGVAGLIPGFSIKPLSGEPLGVSVIKYTHKSQTLPAQYWLQPMEKPQKVVFLEQKIEGHFLKSWAQAYQTNHS